RIDAGNAEEAYRIIDEGYEKIRKGEMKKSDAIDYNHYTTDTTTWEDIQQYAAQGHEFGSHTITHPRLAALDEANMLYELEKSREDILNNLGKEYTFSAECPYGTENERVMEYAHKIYPALRNRMPETWLEELNRGSKVNPGESSKEYVQWQRGPVKKVSMEMMKSWVDTLLVHDNIWLVLVFHGVDDIGWEARTGAELEEYFGYMKEREDDLWVATFAEVTKYLRERKAAEIKTVVEDDLIKVDVTHSLDREWYNIPLTLKTYVPSDWSVASLKMPDGETLEKPVNSDESGSYLLYECLPGKGQVVIEKLEK
ncbi:MAG: polysaccharide deacetylase family protein, partial [Cyclobacteriaceae bacterium]|nr:polysaccharide deacetylase family protein [Cyclobacteriaceae bacterium]